MKRGGGLRKMRRKEKRTFKTKKGIPNERKGGVCLLVKRKGEN